MPSTHAERELNSYVIYASHAGNTARIAEVIAEVLAAHGRADLAHAEEVATLPDDIDLLVIGGPTEGHGPTPEIKALLPRIAGAQVAGMRFASFDTRLRWPKWLSGSAAGVIGAALRDAGATPVMEPESFMVSTKPELLPGEVERARHWAAALGTAATEMTPHNAMAELVTGGRR